MIALELKNHFLRALNQYISSDYFDLLIEAKKRFSSLAGSVNEEDDHYESKMRAFNEWYIFDFMRDGLELTLMKEYLLFNCEIPDDQTYSLLNTHYSLFVFHGKKGAKYVFEDLVLSKRYQLSEDMEVPVMVKDDLFTGRMIVHAEGPILLDGLTLIPKELKVMLVKHLKSLKTIRERVAYLRRIELLAANWIRFRHIDAKRYFTEKLSSLK